MSIIKNINISNFKAIGDDKPIAIEFAPVTLLFGPNSAGKSSVIQAMHYAYEVLVRRNFDADKTLIGGKSVELGGFLNMVHQHDDKRSIEISFELDLSETDLPEYFTQYHTSPSEIEEKFSGWENIDMAKVIFSITWSEIMGRPYVDKYFSFLNGDWVGSIFCSADGKRVDLTVPDYAPVVLYAGDDDDEILERSTVHWDVVHSAFINDDDSFGIGVMNTNDALPTWGRVLEIDPDAMSSPESDAANVREFTEQFSRMVVGPGELLAEELEKLLYLGPLRDVPERNLQLARSPAPGRWASGLAAWDALLNGSKSLLENLNLWLDTDTRFNTGYQIRRESFREVPIDMPIDQALEKAAQGELSGFDFNDLKEWLDDLPIRHRIELLDTRSGVALLPQDLGIGISQMLPVLVAAFIKEDGLVMIEQPELHIHPALQVEMGDLFIERSVSSGCDFLIETHSEHLLLRLLRRIRETNESGPSPGMPDFYANQLAVYYIEPGENDGAAEARRLIVTDDGDFNEDWPNGFFEERAAEFLAMYAEYALDPVLLDNWKDFRFYAESFGWDTGRLIAQYPKSWKKKVFDVISAADIQPVKKASMRERLNRLDCLIRRHGMTWEESRTWLDNALEECAREPFHCIISRNSAPGQSKLLCDDDIPGAGTLWDPPDDVVPRIAAEIAAALSLLLRSAKRVVLVDPYFNPTRAEVARSLQAILQQVARNEQASGNPVRIYVSMDRYFRDGDDRTAEEIQRILHNFEHACQENMPRLIPAGMTVEVTMLARRENGERLHNRYVITERSGVCLGAGLAETDEADSSTDDLGRMSAAKHDLRWAQYAGERGAFDVVGSSIVVVAS